MVPELGLYFLCLALGIGLLHLVHLFLMIVPSHFMGAGAPKGRVRGNLNKLYVLSIYASFLCLAYAFYHDDFTVNYIAQNSNSLLPTFYKLAAIWGAHEGSFLLWITILATWQMIFSFQKKHWPLELYQRTLFILQLIAVAFVIFLLFTSNPFVRNFSGLIEGRDLNPLLQDFGLVVHPPMLYMGYVGSSVSFAIALAILWQGQYQAHYARLMQPWTLLTFSFLTLGIALGSHWAYRELGWGGFWFWDPVENASFIPWLLATGLIHSLRVTEKRDLFKNWSLLLAILCFSTSLLGTFVVRSGVITSVHAFANDPLRGTFLLILLACLLILSLGLYAWRAPRFVSSAAFGFWSREFFLLLNNLLMVVGSATVLVGTLYPMIIDILGLGKLSVGPEYFNTIFIPLALLMMSFMGVAVLCYWYQSQLQQIKRPLLINMALCIVAVVLIYSLGGVNVKNMQFMLAMWCLIWLLASLMQTPEIKLNKKIPWGMYLSHIGVALFVFGVSVVSQFGLEKEVKLRIGDTVQLGNYNFKIVQYAGYQGPNYGADTALFQIQPLHSTNLIYLNAEKRHYPVAQMSMTEAGIKRHLFTDIYIAMGEKLSTNLWTFRLYLKPFISFIWLGALFIFLGGTEETWRKFRYLQQIKGQVHV